MTHQHTHISILLDSQGRAGGLRLSAHERAFVQFASESHSALMALCAGRQIAASEVELRTASPTLTDSDHTLARARLSPASGSHASKLYRRSVLPLGALLLPLLLQLLPEWQIAPSFCR